MPRSISQAGSETIAVLSGEIEPSKPQRAGMTYISHLRCGTVVIGTISPPRTTWGIKAMGVSAIAASDDATTVDRSRPIDDGAERSS